jgi:glutamyl-tRNA synthetase
MLVSALQWAGINYEEGPSKGGPHAPYSQSERTEIYRSHADQLLEVTIQTLCVTLVEKCSCGFRRMALPIAVSVVRNA